ncbi:MAG: hypothetical protein KKG47_09650 [Proteobacteria bacterium]|nr:hypothetical protein [Pseudomonadota bacterium]MBU1736537.1 hypothetical protein [Pseudomonadota bacterium]
MRRTAILTLLLASTLIIAQTAFAEEEPKVPMAKLCGSCHQPAPGVMMGFLESIALKSKTLQMDFMSHKEVVRFTDDTKVKYVNDFADIRNYVNKGFQINFVEKDGQKIATEIIRFDIMKVEALSKEDFITKDEFNKLRKNQNAKVYDVRPPEVYSMGHIPGAMMMPAPAFDKFKKNLPEDRTTPIIYYGVGGCLSPTAALGTKALGFTDVKIFAGGFPEWSKSEYSMVSADWLRMAIEKDIPHVLIDLRPAAEVVSGHINGAVNIPLADLEKSRDLFPARKNAPIILYGPGSKNGAEQLVSWGYTGIRVLPLSFSGWKALGHQVATGPTGKTIHYVPKPKEGTISIEEFKKAAAGMSPDVILVDVRNPDEFAENKLKGTLNIPVDVISERVALMGSSKELILFCNTGTRAEMAHNILKRDGVKNRYLDAMVTIDDGALLQIEEK